MKNYIKLEWWNSCDLARIYYAGGFKNRVFLDADIGEPEYLIDFEGSNNGAGVFIEDYSVLQKVYQFKTYVPQYLLDAFQLIPQHDNIRITFTNGLYSTTIRNVSIESEWDENLNQCLALVTFKFQQDDQSVKNNCCVNL